MSVAPVPSRLNRLKRSINAPAITHHDKIFYVACTQGGGNGNFVVTAPVGSHVRVETARKGMAP